MARRTERRSPHDDGGDFWAPIAFLLAGLLSILVLVAALPDERRVEVPDDDDPREALRALVADQSQAATQWRDVLTALCNDPQLQVEEVAPDCETGTMTFGDSLFDDSAEVQLTEEGIRKLHLAIAALLRNLRSSDVVWENIESIELRGHADPIARRDPYVTNMRVSQKRPLAIMFYLISDWGLSQHDRDDLERLLVLSAASHSRPPENCPERNRGCYPYWRRVEMTPRLKNGVSVDRMNALVDGVTGILGEDG